MPCKSILQEFENGKSRSQQELRDRDEAIAALQKQLEAGKQVCVVSCWGGVLALLWRMLGTYQRVLNHGKAEYIWIRMP